MTLRAELAADQDTRQGNCKVCTWLEGLPIEGEEGQKAWDEAILDRSFNHSSLSRAMERRGFIVSHFTVIRHRKMGHRA